VVLDAEATTMGDKSYTLNGTFNLVYFGGAGALKCQVKQPEPDAGSTETTGGKVEVQGFKKPAGSTCGYDPCDGGTNTSKNCCPYAGCWNSKSIACAEAVMPCAMQCMADQACQEKCVENLTKCLDDGWAACGATASCKTAFGALMTCEKNNKTTCDALDTDEAQDACYFDKCCNEIKAAF
jgi:hypothetical protein